VKRRKKGRNEPLRGLGLRIAFGGDQPHPVQRGQKRRNRGREGGKTEEKRQRVQKEGAKKTKIRGVCILGSFSKRGESTQKT